MVDFAAHMRWNRAAYPTEFDAGHLRAVLHHPAVTEEILAGQHNIRAWEYSRALKAFEAWWPTRPNRSALRIADVGGAGSDFYRTLINPDAVEKRAIDVIDPDLASPDGQRGIVHGLLPGATAVKFRLEGWAGYSANSGQYDVVFCLSVLEHVGTGPEDFGAVLQFFSALRALVRPGGLLFLTCDMGEKPPDVYHFHWMRSWIPTPEVLAGLVEESRIHYGFDRLGAPADYSYRGATVYDYTVAAMALVRKL